MLLAQTYIPRKIKFLDYLRYIMCFKLWKKFAHLSLSGIVRRKQYEEIRLLLGKLNPPHDFMSQYEKKKWSNWPKLTMAQDGTPDTVARDLKNIAFILYNSNLPLKECVKVNFVFKIF